MLQFFGSCEDEESGCLSVEAMDDVDACACVLFLDIRTQDRVGGCLGRAGRSGNGEQSGLFINHDEVVIFINDLEFGMIELRVTASGRDGDDIAGLEGEVMARLDSVAHFDATLTQ